MTVLKRYEAVRQYHYVDEVTVRSISIFSSAGTTVSNKIPQHLAFCWLSRLGGLVLPLPPFLVFHRRQGFVVVAGVYRDHGFPLRPLFQSSRLMSRRHVSRFLDHQIPQEGRQALRCAPSGAPLLLKLCTLSLLDDRQDQALLDEEVDPGDLLLRSYPRY
ncbi:GL14595 [Drosophila persimilis]|uniref:GL14595 n=1 Tax=Drosophila persimilis TaxID=7234 RepID=B4GVV4_DROPE|nr:GL14595 [Drosophila persimilis]